MRKDIKINVDTQTDGISLSSRRLGISSENLQGKIIFTPKPFIDGICRMYIEGHGSVLMDKQEDCYTLDIKSSLLITPHIDVCFKITEPEQDNGVPIYATKIMHFEVLDTIESNEPIPEQYPQWKDVLDNYAEEKKGELDTYTTEIQTDLKAYKTDLEKEISTTKDTLVNDFNSNAESKTNAFNDNATEKTTNYNTNAETKIKEYNDNTTAKLEEYNTNATNKVNEFNNNVDSLENELSELASQMPWNTTEIQDSIHIEDSAKYSRNKLDLFGNLVQEKRSGKNLIDFSNYVGKASTIEYSFTDDVVVATQKSAQSYAGVSFDILDIVKNNPSKELKFVYENLDVSNFTSTNKIIAQIEVTDNGTKTYRQVLDKNNVTATYTIPDDTSDITLAVLRIYTNNSATAIETSTVKITKPMLLFTDITDETYEKYGAMPSIEYPSMPVVATGVQKITKCGKNLFNKNAYNMKSLSAVTGTFAPATNQKHVFIKCESNTNYIIQKDISLNTVLGVYVTENEPAVGDSYTSLYFSSTSTGKVSVQTTSTAKYLDVRINTEVITQEEIDSILSTLMIAKGTDTGVSYEPYTEEIFELDLGTTELCKIVDENGNVVAQDRVVYKDGKWQWEKNVGKYILKNAVWNKSSKTEVNRYYCNIVVYTATGGRDKKDLVSNCFKTISIIQSDANDIGICRYNDRGFIINFDLYDTNFDTLEKFNEYIQNSDAMVYYPNKSVIYEDCTPAQSQVLDKLYKLSLQQGTNNIYVESENGVTTELQLTYMQDLMSQINELKQAMLNIGGN